MNTYWKLPVYFKKVSVQLWGLVAIVHTLFLIFLVKLGSEQFLPLALPTQAAEIEIEFFNETIKEPNKMQTSSTLSKRQENSVIKTKEPISTKPLSRQEKPVDELMEEKVNIASPLLTQAEVKESKKNTIGADNKEKNSSEAIQDSSPIVPTKIELPSKDAQYLKNPPPLYPTISKRLHEEGTVLLKVLIQSNGQATEVEIKKSSGFERLDQAALEAAKKWSYQPGTVNGKATSMWFNIPIRFILE